MKREGLVVLFIVLLLGLRFYYYFSKPHLYKDGDKIRITSKVISEPLHFDNRQYLKIEGLKIYLPPYPEISYGDRIVVEGIVSDDKLEKAKLVKATSSSNYLYQFRNKLLDFYQTTLPSQHAGLVAGMAIGSKSEASSGFYEVLKKTGTAHVVVASGMNISLVGGFLITVLTLFLRRRLALILALAGIWLYALLTGFDAPIIRVSIMGTIVFLSMELGRINVALRSLLISGLLMLFIYPEWITDVGFLLSFFATLSLIAFQKRIYMLFKFVPGVIREDLSTTTAAQIGVIPILFFAFGQFNIPSPIINAMVLWTVPFITIIGIVGGIVGLFVPNLGGAILLLSYPMTWWFIKMVELFNF